MPCFKASQSYFVEEAILKNIKLPLQDQDIEGLKAGDAVSLSGTIYTARDAAHMRLMQMIKEGKKLPIPIEGQVIYYSGASPTPPGQTIGACGPTTSYRMDEMTIPLLKRGLKGMIGKGLRSKEVKKAIKDYHSIYFAAIGGAGALIAGCILSSEVIAFDDLGTEAIRKLEVENLPLVVAIDAKGYDFYEMGPKQYLNTLK